MSAIRNSVRVTAVSAVALGGALLLVGPASAHVTLSPGEGHAGSYVVGTIAVPHGCGGSATPQDRHQDPGRTQRGHPDDQPAVDGREEDRQARYPDQGRRR